MANPSPHRELHPANWKPAKGYANGIAAEGRTVWIGGQIGWNGDQVFETDDFVGQVRQALENIAAVLAEAGAEPRHVVRMTWYITDKQEYLTHGRELGEVYRDIMGRHYPAMAMVEVAGLMDDRAKVEIETTAVVPHPI